MEGSSYDKKLILNPLQEEYKEVSLTQVQLSSARDCIPAPERKNRFLFFPSLCLSLNKKKGTTSTDKSQQCPAFGGNDITVGLVFISQQELAQWTLKEGAGHFY